MAEATRGVPTFGAMAAWQAWVLIAGASGLAAYLFLLKVRPRRVTVPSLLLWARVFNDAREQTLWERIRRAVHEFVFLEDATPFPTSSRG